MKTASILYGLALLTLPAGPGVKLMVGREEMLWMDPTLVFATLAFIALIPIWNSSDSREMAGPTLSTVVLTLLCMVCAVSGFLIRPSTKPYDALREPIRLFLTMIWLLTSYWFLRFRRRFVFRCAAAAAVLALLSGIYIDLVAAWIVPAPAQVVKYAQEYILRQVTFVGGHWIPRMGGLFVEAPPFGLFMLAMAVFFYLGRRSGIRGPATLSGLIASMLGLIASLADQAFLGMAICVSAIILSTKSRRTWLKPALVTVFGAIMVVLSWGSLEGKLEGASSNSARHIYQDSVGERAYHVEYGLSLFEREPVATIFGVGPGRYGEYVAETGLFPDTASMQTTEPEILVEWGVLGLGVWIVVMALVARRAWKLHGLLGVGLLLGVCVADSFQSNWKSEAVFLAVAAICCPALTAENGETDQGSALYDSVEAPAG